MRIGRCRLFPFSLTYWAITVGIRSANGSDDYPETSDSKSKKLVLDCELDESDLINFLTAPAKADDIVVALFYVEGCQSSMHLVPTWKEAIYQLRQGRQSAFSDVRLPLVASFLITPSNKHFLQAIPVTHVPSIVFFSKTGDDKDSAASFKTLEYQGSRSSGSEILNGLRHYLLRFQHSGFQADHQASLTTNLNLNALAVQVDRIEEMGRIVAKFQDRLFQRNNLPLDPIMSLAERDWARYMLDESSDPDFYHVICQCQDSRDPTGDDEALNEAYSAFDEVAGVLSVRRDVVFCVQRKCLNEGVITSYQVVENNWTLTTESSLDLKSVETTDWRTKTSFFCQMILRPSLLWLDRQASAPIIFSPNNRLHAALFIDFHNPWVKEKMRQTVVEFRRECKSRREHNVVCYVVPSTDVRFLLQFGIDMWSPIDKKLHSQDSFPSIGVFPCLLVTDKRQDMGIDYRILEHPFASNSLGNFLDSIIKHDGDLEAQDAQHYVETRKNSFGIHLLAASSLQSFIDSKDCHSMIIFYSPSCGHCKRLKVVWNALGELLSYTGLDNRLKLGMYDVSKNELYLQGVTVLSVPEVYLFSFGTDPIRYNTEEAGGINDSIDIIEWWIDVSSENNLDVAMSEKELLGLLEGDETQ
ncbi:unnamed protein product [Cylindrotheca closterium]|uniref:protein disulfide-isomerase n=1 Tax=Cylindrotheca closterium TaxID=2856 RepID=A0AAD2FU39_9STRA|nr:unnamed protein product [Cylindrotheca closterium]